MVAINLNPDFGYVVMVGAAMSLHCMLQGFAVGSARKKFKVDYPDMGCGRFSAKLTDKEWEEFNNVQRSHQNYIEGLMPALVFLFLGAIFQPRVNAGLGVAYIVGRALYARGYVKSGPKGRLVGAVVFDIGLLGMMGTAFYSGLKIAGLV